MSGMNIGQTLLRSILKMRWPGLKIRTKHSAANSVATADSCGAAVHDNYYKPFDGRQHVSDTDDRRLVSLGLFKLGNNVVTTFFVSTESDLVPGSQPF